MKRLQKIDDKFGLHHFQAYFSTLSPSGASTSSTAVLLGIPPSQDRKNLVNLQAS